MRLQLILIRARSIGWRAVKCDAVDIPGRNRDVRQHRLAGHSVITVRVVPRYKPFVAPEPVNALPGHHIAQRRGREKLVQPPWSRPARQADRESTGIMTGEIDDPLCDPTRQRLRIWRDIDALR